MKKIRKILAIAPGCLAAMLYGGNLLADLSDVYVGMDLLKTNYSTKSGYGSNVFGKDPVATNFFVGYKLPHNLYLELGYERTKSKKRSTRVDGNDSLPGDSDTLLAGGYIYLDVSSKIKVEHPYLGLGINYNLLSFPKITLSALAGVALTKLQAQYIIPDDAGVPFPNGPVYTNYSKRALTPLLKIGANYQFSHHVSMRFSGEWHRMSNFKIKAAENPDYEIRAKNNSFATGVGIVYSF